MGDAHVQVCQLYKLGVGTNFQVSQLYNLEVDANFQVCQLYTCEIDANFQMCQLYKMGNRCKLLQMCCLSMIICDL